MTHWFEDESFWEVVEPFLFPEERFAAAETEVSRLLELIDFEGREVLDLCCGPGRHSIELARRGYVVTGVDLSSLLLDKARQRAAGNNLEIEWVASDMRSFVRPESFDLAINLYTSFGYFENPQDDMKVLSNVRASLRTGGRLVMQMAGKELLASIFQPSSVDEVPGAGLLAQRRTVLDDWSRIRNEWTLIRDDEARTVTFSHFIYSARELKEMLTAAGFGEVRIYGDLEGHDYGPGAERLVAVAVK